MITLLSEKQLLEGIEKQAEILNVYYREVRKIVDPVAVLCVLDGSIWFTGQILTKLKFDLLLGSVTYKRYEGEKGKEEGYFSPPSISVSGKEVLVLDDIYDEGFTMGKLVDMCWARGAKDVKSCVLLNKQRERRENRQPDFFVTEVGNHFVLGSGLDVNGLYRNMPGIMIK